MQRAGCRPPGGGGAGRGARRGRGAGQLLPLRLPRRRSAAYFAHEFRGRGSVAGGRAAATGARRGWSRSAPGSGRTQRAGARRPRAPLRDRRTDRRRDGHTSTPRRLPRPHPLAPTPSPRRLLCMAQTFLPGRNTLSPGARARARAFSSA